MGANPTQAQGLVVFLIGFTLLAGAFAAGGNMLLLLGGLVLSAVSAGIFLRCKPWEHSAD
jgi:hypothetical protein